MTNIIHPIGINIIENKLLRSGQALFMKEENTLIVWSIYPFFFLGCGKTCTIDECVDSSIRYALNKVQKMIDKY